MCWLRPIWTVCLRPPVVRLRWLLWSLVAVSLGCSWRRTGAAWSWRIGRPVGPIVGSTFCGAAHRLICHRCLFISSYIQKVYFKLWMQFSLFFNAISPPQLLAIWCPSFIDVNSNILVNLCIASMLCLIAVFQYDDALFPFCVSHILHFWYVWNFLPWTRFISLLTAGPLPF